MEALQTFGSDLASQKAHLRSAKISVTPAKIFRLLVYIGIGLLIAYIITGFLNKVLHIENFFASGLYYVFDLDGENNIPAAFSFLILLFASSLLAFISLNTTKRQDKKYWWLLSCIFLFLGLDEFIQVHEHISSYIKANYVNSVAGSDYVWVLPYGVFALMAAIFFLRFLLRLPPKTRRLILASGSIYVVSALGIDYVQGIVQHHIETQGLNHFYYKIFTIVEEPGEMLGVSLFIYALLDYSFPTKKISFDLNTTQPAEESEIII